MDVVTVSPATVISSRLISVFRHGAFSGPDDAMPATARPNESSGGTAASAVGRRLNMRSRRDLNTGREVYGRLVGAMRARILGRQIFESAELQRRQVSLAGCAERQLEVKPLRSLEVVDNLEEVASLRVAAWT